MHKIRVGIAQINPTVGDLDRNTEKIMGFIDQAKSLAVDLLTFPELAITGYPPEDLLLKPQFISQNKECLDRIIEHSSGIAIVVGFVDSAGDIYNAAAVVYDRKLAGVYHKIYLPNYGVFDENRYFQAGNNYSVFDIYGIGMGITICEDMWYEAGPAIVQAYAGARVLINISASPYHAGKGLSRERMLATRASDGVAIVIYNNLVGGQDELVFDGQSMVVDNTGPVITSYYVDNVPDKPVTITLTVTDELSVIGKVDCTVNSNEKWIGVIPNDQVFDTMSEEFSIVTEDLQAGENVIAVKAADDVGNTSYRTFQIDRGQ